MIKVLKINAYYEKYLRQFYANNPAVVNQDYHQNMQSLFADHFGVSNSWETTLQATGDFEVWEVIINDTLSQQKWYTTFHKGKISHPEPLEILKTQIDHFQPDVIIEDAGNLIQPAFRKQCRANHPQLKLILAYDGYALSDKSLFEGVDLMMSCIPAIVADYRQLGHQTFLVPFAFNPLLLGQLKKTTPPIASSFVGSVSLGHEERINFIKALHKKTPTKFWLGNFDWRELARRTLSSTLQGKPGELKDAFQLYMLNEGPAFGKAMLEILYNSLVTFNLHGKGAPNAGNMRMYEATGVGTCLVTDWKPGIEQLWKPDEEIVVYRSQEEAIEKINYLCTHPDIAIAIGKKGHERTFEDYQYKKRLSPVIQFIYDKMA